VFFWRSSHQSILWPTFGILVSLAACHQSIRHLDPSLHYSEQPNNRPLDKTGIEEFSDRLKPVEPTHAETIFNAGIRRLSLDNSPEVLETKAQLAIAQAKLKSASTWSNPDLEARLLSNADGDILSEAALTFRLPIGGRVSASEEEALAAIRLAGHNLAAARKKAIWRADMLMAQLAHQKARQELLKKLLLRSKNNATLASSRLQASLADSVEVTLLLAEAAKDRRMEVKAQADLTQTKQELYLLMGLAPGENRKLQVEALTPFKLSESPERLTSDSHKNNPEILRAKLQLELADRHAANVAAERIPDLKIGPALESAPTETAFGVKLGFEIPLLSTGSASYQKALAKRQAAVSAYRQVCRTAEINVSTHLSRLASLTDEMRDFATQPNHLIEDAIALAEEQYAAGKTDVLRLLSVHRAQVALEEEYFDLLLATHKALINLELAVGRPVAIEKGSP
jgi:outer membrane protein TolC